MMTGCLVPRAVRILLAAAALGGFATMARAESLEITGYSGVLGEWELTGNLTATAPDRGREFAGPVRMRHVGYCTSDGPEERTAELRLRLSEPSPSRLTATLMINGIECSYSGRQAEGYAGSLKCPGRRAVPLILWLK